MRNVQTETGLCAEQEHLERREIVRKVHPKTSLSAEHANVERGAVVTNVILKQGCLQSRKMKKDKRL